MPRAAVARLVAECVAVDGVAPLSGHVLAALDDARYLLVNDGGDLVGVAVLPAHDPAELAVAPAFRRRGIGGALVSAVLAEGASIWAHGNGEPARRLAARRGLRVVRELWQLRRSLDVALPVADVPDGVRIRTFRVGFDEDALLAVNARAFAWHPEQGRLDVAGLAAEVAQDWFDPAGFFLAVDSADRVLGFHWTKVHAVDSTPPSGSVAGPVGEIYVLGVDPAAAVRGLGTPLSVAGLEYLRDRGLATAMLYVEADNVRAVRLYERLGFDRYLTDVVYAR